MTNVSPDADITAEVTITVDVDESTLSEGDIEGLGVAVADFLEGYNYTDVEYTGKFNVFQFCHYWLCLSFS